MEPYLKKIINAAIFILTAISVPAQQNVAHSEDAPGKITGIETGYIFKQIDAVKNIDRTKAASLKKCLASQLKIFYAHPLLNPPKGFTVSTAFGISKDPFAKNISFPSCSLSFGLYYLNKDAKTGEIKTSMDGTLVGLETNAEDHFFRQVGNFWDECSNTNFPLFFEQPPISDSTADYIELNFKKYGYDAIAPDKPFRIVKRNDRPLFVPLNRKEFLQFLIAAKKYQILEDEKKIPEIQKEIKETQQTLKAPGSYMTEDVLKALAVAVTKMEKNIAEDKEGIKKEQEKIKEYQSMIDAMPSQEANSPVRLDENKKMVDFDPLSRMVPAGRMEGVGLYKINPDYYDRSPGAPGAQLIFVYYEIPNLSAFEKTNLNYLEKNTITIFNEINYHQLKESMR
jgi:hypothetical protein